MKDLIFLYTEKYIIEFDFDNEIPPVELDVNLFTEVIDNLLLNSIEAMPKGGKLNITLKKLNNKILLKIKDSGHGIPKKLLNKVFEPFFTTKPHEKEGIGLTVANAVVDKHAGEITINSRKGECTEVSIFLNIYNKPEIDKENKSLKDRKLNILVMDDEDIILKILNKFLTNLGHRVDTAVTGEIAIKKYKESLKINTPYDLVIMDLIIPNGMGGEEAIKELLKIDENAKVIVSSGYSGSKIMTDYKKYGFKYVLPKPYKLDELKDIINDVC